MHKIKNITRMLFLCITIFAFCGPNTGKISRDLLKQKIVERLNHRSQIIKDYICEMTTTRLSDSPRGEMKSDMTFRLYKKMPDKRKTEFVEGSRNGEKITKEDFENFGRSRSGRGRESQPSQLSEKERRPPNGDRRGDRMGRMFGPGFDQEFDLLKYFADTKIVGSEKLDNVDTYKLSVKIKDQNERLASATIWLDKATFDVIKFSGILRKGERIDSGEITNTYSPVGPEGIYMLAESKSKTLMVFDSPMGEMEMESVSTSSYKNYQFNQNIADDFFAPEK